MWVDYWGGGGGKEYVGPPLTLYMYIFAFIKLVLNRQIVRFCFTILPEVLNGRLLCMIIAPSEDF